MTSTPQANTPTPTAGKTIEISNFAFAPAQLTVTRGTRVTWINRDSAPHQPVSDSGAVISSGVIQTGGTYSVTFNQPGTYTYHCAIHPSMTGTIVVQ